MYIEAFCPCLYTEAKPINNLIELSIRAFCKGNGSQLKLATILKSMHPSLRFFSRNTVNSS